MTVKDYVILANAYKKKYTTTKQFKEDVKLIHQFHFKIAKYNQTRSNKVFKDMVNIMRLVCNLFEINKIRPVLYNYVNKKYHRFLDEVLEIIDGSE